MFYSILFPTKQHHEMPRQHSEPGYFKDLNLDQIAGSVLMQAKDYWLKDRQEAELKSFIYTPLREPEVILYRQEVLRDLEDDRLRVLIAGFADTVTAIGSMKGMVHESLTSMENGRDNYLTRGQLIACAESYCRAVTAFCGHLTELPLRSAGLRSFSEYLKAYIVSDTFLSMRGHTERLREGFSRVALCMLVKDGAIRVRSYEGQADLVEEIREVFSRFSPEGGQWENRLRVPETPLDMRMEAVILNMAAKLNKSLFEDLDAFCSAYYDFEDETLLRFSREIQFYLLWLEFIAPLRQNGLQFCYPELCQSPARLYSRGGFDLSLAHNKNMRHDAIVLNDFQLREPERIIVVTGPNQGGKTTFARAFGQLHHLASLGLSVPGSEAALYLFDNILTHFEREESLDTQSGKLQEDLIRLRGLLEQATERSIVVINEIFASTTLKDALKLGGYMMEALIRRGSPAVVVTFLDELAVCGPETVSMMSTVSGEDPTVRTYKIVRKPPDGLAYAVHLAGKYGLTYRQLTEEYRRRGKSES